MDELLSPATLAWRPALAVIVIRTLPFAAYVVLGKRGHVVSKLSVLGAWLALAACLGFDVDLLWMTGVLGYYLVCSTFVFVLERAFCRGHVSAGAAFAISAFVFVVVPGLVLPHAGEILVLSLGWELSFSAYSYCREASRESIQPRLRDCCHFLLVNPVLVYPDRGEPLCTSRFGSEPALIRQGIARAAVGALGIALGTALILPIATVLGFFRAAPANPVAALLLFVLAGAARFMAAYFVQAGDVNLRIGLMRWLGHPVADSFNYPFLARSPTDFWRRWNAYMLNWLKRYVYLPLARTRSLRRRGSLGLAVALGGTFLASGLMHELHAYARSLLWLGQFTLQFSAIGAATLAWFAIDQVLKRAVQRSEARTRSLLRLLRIVSAQGAILGGMLGLQFVWS